MSRRPTIMAALGQQVPDQFQTLTTTQQQAAYPGVAPSSIPGSFDTIRRALGVNAPWYLNNIQARGARLRRNLGSG